MITEKWLLANGFKNVGDGLWEYIKADWIEYDLTDYSVCVNDRWLDPDYKYPEELNNLIKALIGVL